MSEFVKHIFSISLIVIYSLNIGIGGKLNHSNYYSPSKHKSENYELTSSYSVGLNSFYELKNGNYSPNQVYKNQVDFQLSTNICNGQLFEQVLLAYLASYSLMQMDFVVHRRKYDQLFPFHYFW